MYLLPASMTSNEKEQGPELKISQMDAPRTHVPCQVFTPLL